MGATRRLSPQHQAEGICGNHVRDPEIQLSAQKPVIANEEGSHFAVAVINICSNKKKSEIRKHAICPGINGKPICAIYFGKIIEEQFIHVKILAL